MTLSPRLRFLLVAAAFPACSVYGPGLFDDINGGGSGGRNSGGSPSSGGADGGSDTGGRTNSGGVSSGGTSGGTDSGGAGDSGGTTSGGTTSGGAPATGGESGGDGGMASGGGSSGGSPTGGSGGSEQTGGMAGDSGTGGTAGCTAPPCLIDDFEGAPSASFANLPYYGAWARYQQTGAVWDGTLTEMMQEDPDDTGNMVLHVKASGLDDWGIGVFVTLKGGAPVDLRGFSAISFRLKSGNLEDTLKVAIADEASHQPACDDVGGGQDCDKHMRSVQLPTMGADWSTVTLDLAYFIDKAVDAVPRSANLNLAKVYAIHIQMEPATSGEAADFYVDDLTLE